MLIELGVVLPGAKLLSPAERDGGVNETFVGLVQTHSRKSRAFIKILAPRQMANELIGTILGRCLGLPIPDCAIAKVEPGVLPDSGVLAGASLDAAAFASFDAQSPSLRRRFSNPVSGLIDAVQLEEALSRWKDRDRVVLFDEWIANVDRHVGNLLMETREKFWLIDHGHILTGPTWTSAHLVPDACVKNHIASHLATKLTLSEKMSLRDRAKQEAVRFGDVASRDFLEQSGARLFLTPTDARSAEVFVRERVKYLQALISNQLGVPNIGGIS